MVYHEQENSGFKDITMGIQGCPNGTSYCSLDILRNFAQTIKPDQPIDQVSFMENVFNFKLSCSGATLIWMPSTLE